MKHPIEGRTVLVAGIGKSGIAARDLLLAKGATVLASDEKPRSDVGFEVLPQTEETFARAELVVLSPGVPTDAAPVEAARRAGIPIIGEVELASYFLRGPVVGITGSNGKTTTTALIGHLLQENGVPCQVGGNIGNTSDGNGRSGPVTINGTCWNCRAFNWRPSTSFGRRSPCVRTSPPIIWTDTTPSRVTQQPRLGSSKHRVRRPRPC
jgi:hypothetical protein